MPIFPPHLQPGSRMAKNEPYTLQHAWPDDCRVEWGIRSIALGKVKPPDRHFFFEAKLQDPKTVIFADGASFAQAEDSAFQHLERIRACPEHEFEHRGLRNGVGFCKHCNLSLPYALEPLEHCTTCGSATYFAKRGKKWYCENHAPEARIGGGPESEQDADEEPVNSPFETTAAEGAEALVGGSPARLTRSAQPVTPQPRPELLPVWERSGQQVLLSSAD